MQGKNFETQTQELLQSFTLQPEEMVWDNIASALKKEKKRRAIIWFFFLLGALLLGSGIVYFYPSENTNLATITSHYKERKAPDRKTDIILRPNTMDGRNEKKNLIVSSRNKDADSAKSMRENIGEYNSTSSRASLVSLYNKPVKLLSEPILLDKTGSSLLTIDTSNKIVADSALKKSKKSKWHLSVLVGGGVSGIKGTVNDFSSASNFFSSPATISGAGNPQGGTAAPANILFKDGIYQQLGVQFAKMLSPKLGMVIGIDYTSFNQYARYTFENSYTKNTSSVLFVKTGICFQFSMFGKGKAQFTNMLGYGQFLGQSAYQKQQYSFNSSLDISLNKRQSLFIGPSINYHFTPAFSGKDQSNHFTRFGVQFRFTIPQKKINQ